jgi:hypothetical protein
MTAKVTPSSPTRASPARELKTIRVMVQMYCRDHHGSPDPQCRALRRADGVRGARLERCVFGDAKPTLHQLHRPLLHPERREEVRVVMRYAGPRMLLRHPWLGSPT